MKTAARLSGLWKDRILGLFRKKKKFVRFRDPLGNFELFYPSGWKFDRDIAVVDGKYTISFEKGSKRFTISVDARLPEKFDFKKYAKAELEGPSSGIIAEVKKDKFRGMPAYSREYRYESGGKTHIGRGVMFSTGRIVFSLTWSAPEKEKDDEFRHMIKTLAFREGFVAKYGVCK